MKKFFSLLAILMMAVTSAWADDPDYLCFTAEKATNVAFSKSGSNWTATPTLQYSTDNKQTWNPYTFGTAISLAAGGKVYFKAASTNSTFSDGNNYIQFTSTGKVAASGNIMSLLDATCAKTEVPQFAFFGMFHDCTNLTTAPLLPATTLANSCYFGMFQNCTSLTTAPALPAATLASLCYDQMFLGCTSLTTAPVLPAATLASLCYVNMFNGCTSLTTAPVLPASTLATDCYAQMFAGCSNLNKVTVNFTDWNASGYATEDWLEDVPSTGTIYCPAELDITTKDASHVPCGWNIVNNILDESTTTKADITALKVATSRNVQINRTFYKDGGNNTLCLPFSLDAAALAASPLAGYTKLQEFSSATIQNEGQEDETLELTMTDVTAIEAGKPYIIAWASDDDLVNPIFESVTITADEGSTSEASNGVQFCGTLVPYAMTANDKGHMFVGANAQLNWPNVDGNLKGFRSYFTVELGQNSPIRQGMPAMLTDGIMNTPTQLDEAAAAEKVQKLIENGHVVILSNGVRYDLTGKVIK